MVTRKYDVIVKLNTYVPITSKSEEKSTCKVKLICMIGNLLRSEFEQ